MKLLGSSVLLLDAAVGSGVDDVALVVGAAVKLLGSSVLLLEIAVGSGVAEVALVGAAVKELGSEGTGVAFGGAE